MRTTIRLALCLTVLSTHLSAADVAIGTVEANGMSITAVYIQPVTMEPILKEMTPADIHLEADIEALKGNQQGFGEGDWVPYLGITYTITKKRGDWSTTGNFMPMAAADGPHYAGNIKLDGPGEYHLRYHITPPVSNGFYRHTDRETGVATWWPPFDLEWDFIYVGVGKKGGY